MAFCCAGTYRLPRVAVEGTLTVTDDCLLFEGVHSDIVTTRKIELNDIEAVSCPGNSNNEVEITLVDASKCVFAELACNSHMLRKYLLGEAEAPPPVPPDREQMLKDKEKDLEKKIFQLQFDEGDFTEDFRTARKESRNTGTSDAKTNMTELRPATAAFIMNEIESNTQAKISVSDVQLGRGSYGKVYLGLLSPNASTASAATATSYVAVKVVPKKEAVFLGSVDSLVNERHNLVVFGKSPFVVHLYGTATDAANIYFVMEFVNGGTLYWHKQQARHRRLPLPTCRFYSSELLLALQFIHSCQGLYLDIKPENLMVDRRGHLRLVDMGSSRILASRDEGRLTATCGTLMYSSPEVLSAHSYSFPADMWSFAAVLFDLCYGKPPFGGNLQGSVSILARIKESEADKLAFPAAVAAGKDEAEEEAKLRRLLQLTLVSDEAKRLTVAQAMASEYYDQVEWNELGKSEDAIGMLRPLLKHDGDCSYSSKPPPRQPNDDDGDDDDNDDDGDDADDADESWRERIDGVEIEDDGIFDVFR